jgi:hypothetical protein
MHKIEPIEVEGTVRGGFTKRPYIVLVDGERLLNSQGTPVRFKDSIMLIRLTPTRRFKWNAQ